MPGLLEGSSSPLVEKTQTQVQGDCGGRVQRNRAARHILVLRYGVQGQEAAQGQAAGGDTGGGLGRDDRAMSYDSTKGWVAKTENHGRVKLSVYTAEEDARAFRIAHREVRPTSLLAVADSGCQACIMGLTQLYKLGLQKSDLCRIRCRSTSINGNNLDIIRVVVLRMAGVDPATGKIVETAAQVRVADGVKDLYISKGVMTDLGTVSYTHLTLPTKA